MQEEYGATTIRPSYNLAGLSRGLRPAAYYSCLSGWVTPRVGSPPLSSSCPRISITAGVALIVRTALHR